VSLRTLSAGFQACHGTSPMRWLREVRLQGAHADLSRADGSVADIALRWGFAHFGRFAAEYARRFGQSPSRTLRR
jgi:transcriptional regulator GlxA family with amidase domain